MKLTKASIGIVVVCLATIVCHSSAEYKRAMRIRRQNPGDAFIDAIFQIPIQTLTAVGTVVKTSRPVFMNVRQRIQQSLTPPRPQPQRFTFGGPRAPSQQASANNKLFNPQQHRFSANKPQHARQ